MATKHERLVQVMDARDLKQKEFAELLELSQGSMSQMLTGKIWLSRKRAKLLESKLNVNLHWLETGEGQMFKTYSPALNKPSIANEPPGELITVTVDPSGDEVALYVPIQAQAGYLTGHGNPQFLSQLPAIKIPPSIMKLESVRLFEVKGDSMEDTIFAGDIIFGQRVYDIKDLMNMRVYVVISKDDGVLVKRVTHHSGEKYLTLYSDNKYYEPQQVQMEDVLEIWYVRRVLSAQLPAPSTINERIFSLEQSVFSMQQQINKLTGDKK